MSIIINFKLIILIIFLFVFAYYNKKLKFYKLEINKYYSKIQTDLNLNFINILKRKIHLGIYTYCLNNGGRARITSILINYLYKIKIFDLYLFTKIEKQENEYLIPKETKRLVIKNSLNNLNKIISFNKIDILIYNLNNETEINYLNKKQTPKIIYYQHSSFFYMIYSNYSSFLSLYKEYHNSKYVVSLIPFESNYIFKFWGINSYLMKNFVTYEYNSIIPSNLKSKTILMIGRGNNKYKRFNLGIYAMEYIIMHNSLCKMELISNTDGTYDLQYLIYNLNLENYVKFIGFSLIPEIKFKNSSLHIFPSISECFPMVLSETKIYGIPNILVGLDYLQISKGGTIIIYDDTPESIAKESMKILNDEKHLKNLGKEARNSMKEFKNHILFYKWVNLILSIYNGDSSYNKLKLYEKENNQNDLILSFRNQIDLLKKRNNYFFNISIKDFINFSNLYQFKIK